MFFSYVMRGMAQSMSVRRHKTMPPMPAGLYALPSVADPTASGTAWRWRRRRQRHR